MNNKHLINDIQYINDSLVDEINKFKGNNNTIISAIRHNVIGNSKRIRPLIMMQIARMAGNSPENIIRSACAIEFIHCASLIFDDLPCMDNATLRRGKKTLHLEYNESIAILAGLSLLFESFKMINQNINISNLNKKNNEKIMTELFDSIGINGMAHGQHEDIEYSSISIDKNILLNINKKKTVNLIESAIMISSRLNKINKKTEISLMKYGYNIGMAFQIRDDIKDMHEDKKNIIDLFSIVESENLIHEYISNGLNSIKNLKNNEGLVSIAKMIYIK